MTVGEWHNELGVIGALVGDSGIDVWGNCEYRGSIIGFSRHKAGVIVLE